MNLINSHWMETDDTWITLADFEPAIAGGFPWHGPVPIPQRRRRATSPC